MLCRRNCLSVDIERRSQGRVSKQFLHDLELSAHASQERRVCVSEGVPAKPFLNSEFQRHWPDVPENCLSPIWLATSATVACENPIVEFAVALMSLPFLQRVDYDRMNWHGLLRRFCLARTYKSAHDRACHVHRSFREVDVAPLQAEQFTFDAGRWMQRAALRCVPESPNHQPAI